MFSKFQLYNQVTATYLSTHSHAIQKFDYSLYLKDNKDKHIFEVLYILRVLPVHFHNTVNSFTKLLHPNQAVLLLHDL